MSGSSFDLDLDPAHCLARYRHGYYPYFDKRIDKFYWDREAKRFVVPVNEYSLTKARRIEKRLKAFRVTRDTEFELVLAKLADTTIRKDTWVQHKVIDVYRVLHRSGHAFTYEAWDGPNLAGGLLAVDVGRVIAAETMFRVASGASKACVCQLLRDAADSGRVAVDVQVRHGATTVCGRLGEIEVPLAAYLEMLAGHSSGHVETKSEAT